MLDRIKQTKRFVLATLQADFLTESGQTEAVLAAQADGVTTFEVLRMHLAMQANIPASSNDEELLDD